MGDTAHDPWASFTERLRMTLSGMQSGQFFAMSAAHPALEGILQPLPRAQVQREPRTYLAVLRGDDSPLTIVQQAMLAHSGWEPAEDAAGTWCIEAVTSDEISTQIATAVRDVFRLAHPSLLVVGSSGAKDDVTPLPDLSALATSGDSSVRAISAEPIPQQIRALVVESSDHLVAALEDLLSDRLGTDVHADCDGAIAVKVDDVLVLFEPSLGPEPWVHLCALIADNVQESEDLLSFVNEVTADLTSTQLFIRDGSLYAKAAVVGSPFVESAIELVLEAVVRAARDLRTQVMKDFGARDICGQEIEGYL